MFSTTIVVREHAIFGVLCVELNGRTCDCAGWWSSNYWEAHSLEHGEGYIMICPRCGNEWDARKGSCARCGFVIRMTGQAGSVAQPPNTPQRGSSPWGSSPFDGMSTLRQQSGALPAIKQPPGGMPGVNQQSGGLPYAS